MTATKLPRMRSDEAIAVIQDRVDARQPFAMVRLGDGEGKLLGYPDVTPKKDLDRWLRQQLGPKGLAVLRDETRLMRLREELIESLRRIDMFGLVGENTKQPNWRLLGELVRSIPLATPETLYCQFGVHKQLQTGGYFERLLAGQGSVGLVTCRDVGERVGRRFGVRDVVTYLVPEEAKFSENWSKIAMHYPDRFEELRDGFDVRYPGMVFLVGAGFLGKIYCAWIRDRGGVALDIGSIFDGWAGRTTRLYLGEVPALGGEVSADYSIDDEAG